MRVILTHSPRAFQGFQHELQAALGARQLDIVHTPLIRTLFRKDVDIAALQSANYCFFTSQNAVAAAASLGVFPLKARVIAVGAKTAQALLAQGQAVDGIPQQEDAEGLMAEWLEQFPEQPREKLLEPDVHIVLAVGAKSMDTIPQKLAERGLNYQKVILYDTVVVPWQGLARAEDIIILASPSAVHALPQHIGDAATLLAIGTTTQRAAANRGWVIDCAATPYRPKLKQKILELVA